MRRRNFCSFSMKVLTRKTGLRASNRVILSGVPDPWLLPGQLCAVLFGVFSVKGKGGLPFIVV